MQYDNAEFGFEIGFSYLRISLCCSCTQGTKGRYHGNQFWFGTKIAINAFLQKIKIM